MQDKFGLQTIIKLHYVIAENKSNKFHMNVYTSSPLTYMKKKLKKYNQVKSKHQRNRKVCYVIVDKKHKKTPLSSQCA